MEMLLSVFVGVGLSAACGFRIFVPFLVMSMASQGGHLTLSPNWEWIGSDYALIAFATASTLEVLSYYIPWVDNLMDTLATPAAITTGTIVMATQINDVSPFLQWSLALVAGGGTAGAIQSGTVLIRGLSTTSTGGLGNPIISTVELGGSVATGICAILFPFIIFFLIAVGLLFLFYKMSRAIFGQKKDCSDCLINATTQAPGNETPLFGVHLNIGKKLCVHVMF